MMLASFILILSFPLPVVHPEGQERFVPLPLTEIEQLLSQWFFDSGFKVLREEREGSGILLRGMKGREVWEVTLRPYSPLASRIQPHYTIDGKLFREKEAVLWDFLENYLKESQSKRTTLFEEVPINIQARLETVVCIQVNQGQEEIQFTGFGIDPKGIILSTAHDLKGVQEVRVFLNDGRVRQGVLIKMDQQRDLILIDIRSRLKASVPIDKGRRNLQMGQKVFAIGCPNQSRTILSGTINGPLRQVNNLPFYQTEMEIRPGSSGSPVFDLEGNLVGMVKGRYRGLSFTGFLIPLTTILEFLKEK